MRKPAFALVVLLAGLWAWSGSAPATRPLPDPPAATVPTATPPAAPTPAEPAPPTPAPAPQPARLPLLLVTSSHCPWCDRLKQSLQDPAVQQLLAERFDLETACEDRAVEAKYGVQYYPTLVAITPVGAKVKPGYMPPAELRRWLEGVLSGAQDRRPLAPRSPRQPAPAPAPHPSATSIQEGGPVGPGGREVMVDMPTAFWKQNIESGPWYQKKQGCCVWRTLDHSAHYQNVVALFGFPEWVRSKNLPGGGWSGNVTERVAAIARERGLPEPLVFQYEGSKDVKNPKVLELALATGRMPAVSYSGNDGVRYDKPIEHMVNLVYLDQDWACILDNNYPPDKLLWLPRAEFLNRWDGWAVVLLAPRPPAPPRN